MTAHTRVSHTDRFNDSSATDGTHVVSALWDEIESSQNNIVLAQNDILTAQTNITALQTKTGTLGGQLTGTLPNPGVTDTHGQTGVTSHASLQATSAKGAANGYASLDSGVLVPIAQLPTMVASGASHAKGIVPDPGAVAGTTKYLREDGTWATVAAASNIQQDAAYVNNVSGTFTAYQGSDGTVIATGSNPGSVINSAITYVNGLSNGGSVALPNGNIQLTSTAIVGKAGVRLRGQGSIQQQRAGDGYGTTIIGSASTDHTYIIDGLDAWGFVVQDLNVNGNNKTANGIRLAAYRSTCNTVGVSNCTTRHFYLTAGAASSPADAYVNMQLINCYVDGYGNNAKGVVVDGSLGSLVCSDGRIIGLDVFSCGNNGLEIRKADWIVQNAHITANSGVTPADAGVYIASTGAVLDGVVVDSIGHGHFFGVAASGVRLDNCWAVYGGGTDNTHNSVNITAGSGVIVRSFFVQITSAGEVPNYVICNNGDPTGKMRLIDGVFLIGTGTGSPATGMIDYASDIAGSYWVRGVGSHA